MAIGQSPDGLKRESIPRYLLIVGGPEEVPWQFQYVLNGHYATGRLHLKGDALENYVTALRTGWTDAGADPKRAVVWSVNQGSADITGLMHDAIARPVYQDLSADSDLAAGTKFLDGAGAATGAQLRAALAQDKPGLILTTSQGETYPLDNMDLLAEGLGLPVDQDYSSVQLSDLLSEWEPGGTIWYSHACCSAGSCADTLFNGLFEPGSELDRVLKGIAKLSSRVAPLPTALLGAKKLMIRPRTDPV